jgi:hypothetical protein
MHYQKGAMTAAEDANRAPSTVEQPAEPSLLLQAFTRYLRNRPADDDTESIRRFNNGQVLEGISGYSNSLGGVPTITLEPLVGESKRTVVYYHGVAISAGRRPIDTYRWLAPWRSPHRPQCMSSITAWLLKPAFPPPLTIAWPRTGGLSTAEPIRSGLPYSETRPAATSP